MLVRQDDVLPEQEDLASLAPYGVQAVWQYELWQPTTHPTYRKCRTWLARLVWAGFSGSHRQLPVTNYLANIIYTASVVVPFCERQKIRVFLSGEAYHPYTLAMAFIARSMNIATCGYQYSANCILTPITYSGADIYFCFSDWYAREWASAPISPGKTIVSGYPFGAAPGYLAERSAAHRKILADAGATYVLCYFDESVQKGKYGFIGEREHFEDYAVLAQWILNNPSVGVIVKTKFERNAPSQLYSQDPQLRMALQTGRFIELCAGHHRNTILPAEAALAADVVVGHDFALTAALESVLAGTPALLVSLHPLDFPLIHILREHGVVFDDLTMILERIDLNRIHNKEFPDWDPILKYIESVQDGAAPHRIRAHLESLFLTCSN